MLAEKEGGASRSEGQMNEFRKSLDVCCLRDLGFRGCPYRWSNGRDGEDRIRSRLDRCICTFEWMALFPRASVSHEISVVSDHCPILLDLYGNKGRRQRNRGFIKFEAPWIKDDKCEDIIKEAQNLCTDKPES
ncbi:hypothetical protein CFOL_v3_33098 [Cephalotus follicularis]|uniref:Exo_endo_phos domain-containing protein n=1 Tax=Cephalotus follicularis TaxID=3775 RepID=A0A1Q3DB25_CEPFO|nr:hypothetical protein CFOL_v3_33098 [Cephalotus follicularis]